MLQIFKRRIEKRRFLHRKISKVTLDLWQSKNFLARAYMRITHKPQTPKSETKIRAWLPAYASGISAWLHGRVFRVWTPSNKKAFHCNQKKRHARDMQLLNAQLRRAAHRACVQFKYIYSVASITRHHCRWEYVLTGLVDGARWQMAQPVHHVSCKQSVCCFIVMHTEHLRSL
jgi:hypothetical protein